MTRTRRTLTTAAAALAALLTLIAVLLATGLVTVYDAPGNAGIVIGVPCHNLGYEYRGTPGLFADACE